MSRQFSLNWRVSIFAFVCLVLFVNLGFWQLNREIEKREFLAELSARESQRPMLANELPIHGDLSGVPVRLTGEYGDVVALLDNRVLKGIVGFEVHQIFYDDSRQVFLVNRGFVAMGRTRADPVVIPEVRPGKMSIHGKVYQSNGAPLLLKREQGRIKQFPAILQLVEMERLSDSLNVDIYPYVIRLATDQPGTLPRYWPSTVMSPQKHRGYAVQWFAMAFTVLITWLFFSFRVIDED